MKKLGVLLLVLCLWGCNQQTVSKPSKANTEIYQQLMNNIKITMPSDVYNALKNKEIYIKVNNTFLIANDKENPTLRLDFTYQDGKLVQYVSKKYGFVDNMKDDKINEENAKTLIQLFAMTFFNQEVALSKITPLSGYETENYMIFEDIHKVMFILFG